MQRGRFLRSRSANPFFVSETACCRIQALLLAAIVRNPKAYLSPLCSVSAKTSRGCRSWLCLAVEQINAPLSPASRIDRSSFFFSCALHLACVLTLPASLLTLSALLLLEVALPMLVLPPHRGRSSLAFFVVRPPDSPKNNNRDVLCARRYRTSKTPTLQGPSPMHQVTLDSLGRALARGLGVVL